MKFLRKYSLDDHFNAYYATIIEPVETGIIDGQGRISIKFIKDNVCRRIDYLKIVPKTLKLL